MQFLLETLMILNNIHEKYKDKLLTINYIIVFTYVVHLSSY